MIFVSETQVPDYLPAFQSHVGEKVLDPMLFAQHDVNRERPKKDSAP
jgi:hypothetical protein